ncbi:cytochrome c [Phenylobacterium sp.]|jgi:mono/diheme cytochrome c family protein|uniref:cytochrome c n=1 Tax=Phenylobacterium sp. TaxID=1871053 RepID=UPI002F42C2F2
MTVRRGLRWAALAVGAIAVLGLALVLWMAKGPGPIDFAHGAPLELAAYRGASPTGTPPELAGAPLLARGEYLTRAADCEACHTARGGVPFTGGRPFKLPFGTLYTPNITPDPGTGIGAWNDAEFLRAMHQGVGRGGKPLYPAFPYPSYTLLTDADALAIKAYLFSLKPVRNTAPANALAFPFNQRWLMTIWAALFNSDRRFRPIAERSAEWNRGAYLAEAAEHCGECHTPRNLMQALDNRRKFAGGVAEGWNAYNITSDRSSGIGDWSAAQVAQYLSSGHAEGRGAASGPMREAVDLSLRHLTPGDIAALTTYLRTVPALRSANLPMAAGPAPASPRKGPANNPTGKRIFEGACASCHAWTGAGAMISEAQLTGVRSVNDPSAANVARMILAGAGRPGGHVPYMPSFAASYTDTEIAAVANYVVARFGSKPSYIGAADVARMRAEP